MTTWSWTRVPPPSRLPPKRLPLRPRPRSRKCGCSSTPGARRDASCGACFGRAQRRVSCRVRRRSAAGKRPAGRGRNPAGRRSATPSWAEMPRFTTLARLKQPWRRNAARLLCGRRTPNSSSWSGPPAKLRAKLPAKLPAKLLWTGTGRRLTPRVHKGGRAYALDRAMMTYQPGHDNLLYLHVPGCARRRPRSCVRFAPLRPQRQGDAALGFWEAAERRPQHRPAPLHDRRFAERG